ncbi:MAG: hypothetical protein WBQ38_12430 [Ignavibacteria bacterium]
MNTEIYNCHGIVKNFNNYLYFFKAPSRDVMISGLMEIIIDNSVTIAKIITHNFQLKSEQVIIGAAYSMRLKMIRCMI